MIFMHKQENYEKIQEHCYVNTYPQGRGNHHFDDDIEVTVLAVKGNQVRLGIKAPDHIAVHREEIYQRLMGDNPGNHSGDE